MTPVTETGYLHYSSLFKFPCKTVALTPPVLPLCYMHFQKQVNPKNQWTDNFLFKSLTSQSETLQHPPCKRIA